MAVRLPLQRDGAHPRAHLASGEPEPLLPQLAHLDAAALAFEHQRESGVVVDAHVLERIHEKADAHSHKLCVGRAFGQMTKEGGGRSFAATRA